ncbi:MAG: hypothetical protein AAGD43_03515 [Pseudomonadota bacterium]
MREACLLLALTGVSFVGIETELSVGSMTGQQIFIIYGKNVVPNGSGTDSVRQKATWWISNFWNKILVDRHCVDVRRSD